MFDCCCAALGEMFTMHCNMVRSIQWAEPSLCFSNLEQIIHRQCYNKLEYEEGLAGPTRHTMQILRIYPVSSNPYGACASSLECNTYKCYGNKPKPSVQTLQMQARTALAETSKDGAFKRKDSTYRSWIGPGKDFPAEGTEVPGVLAGPALLSPLEHILMVPLTLQLGGTICISPLHALGHADA